MALRGILVATVVALAACASDPTEVVIVADTDYPVPGSVDQFRIRVEDPSGGAKESTAALASAAELPRTLGLVHEGGPLGPFTVTLTGLSGGTEVASRQARFSFQEGRILRLTLRLVASCAGTSCGADQTCAESGCRPIDVAAGELVPWDGVPARMDGGVGVDSGPPDAGNVDACVPTEVCNGADDDCDGDVDEGFDLTTDPMNCGMCGRVCDFQNGTGTCTAGDCAIDSCNSGFDDCDGNGANGCETDLGSSAANCGTCGTACSPPNRVCCAASCAREC